MTSFKRMRASLKKHEDDSNPHGGVFITPSSTDTLTNKTIDLASNTVTSTLAQLNTAVSDANVASLAGAETLTNKTIAGASNTLTVREADLSIADNTTANVSASAHGLCPKIPNNTTTFLRGDGTFAAPSGGAHTLIAETELGADATSIAVTGISAGYAGFYFLFFVQEDATGGELGLRMNASASALYNYCQTENTNTTIQGAVFTNASAIWLKNYGAVASSKKFGGIFYITNTANAYGKGFFATAGHDKFNSYNSGFINITSEISGLSIIRFAGNFIAGSKIIVIGVN